MHYTNPRPVLSDLGRYYTDDYAPYQRQRGEMERSGKLSTAVRSLVLRERYGSATVRPGKLGRAAAKLIGLVKSPEHFGFAVPWHGRGRLLDFGCGNGTFLRRMKNLGWEVCGVDFSPAAVKAVRESGIEAHEGSLPHEGLKGRRFDVITLRQSLEHLADPMEVLGGARELLEADGRVVVQVPNYASWEVEHFGDAALSLDLPRHLLHFRPETLRKTLERCMFFVESVHVLSKSGGLRKSLKQVERRGEARGLDVWLKYKPVCQWAAWRAGKMGKGNELLAIARKKD